MSISAGEQGGCVPNVAVRDSGSSPDSQRHCVEEIAYEVEFIDVGRNKHRWTERLKQQPTEAILAKLVKKRGALMSSDIECEDGAVIVGGWRPVGRYEIREVRHV